MNKLWAGRASGEVDKIAEDFNSSIKIDKRMYKEDIYGSIAHAKMLEEQKIISEESAENIKKGLQSILEDIESGKLVINESSEDIHTFVEQVLTERIGDDGKKLHTARSRNDQVALDLRMYLKKEIILIDNRLKHLIACINDCSRNNTDTIMPGYTHLQRAQPVTFGHYLAAYSMMFLRDRERLRHTYNFTNISPIGSCALAGTTYNINRQMEAQSLGFSDISRNSMDGVSDRDFAIEFLSDMSIIMMHLSRLCEELILWSSWEFQFIELSDSYTTGSSIMPQKKNPDIAELVRGKTGRVYGDLITLLTIQKALPLTYNKDMQEDKECIFDAADTVLNSLSVIAPMISTMTVKRDNMLRAAKQGFINATDLADYLVGKGLSFRNAYKISGQIVSECIKENCTLENFPLTSYKEYSELFEEDLYSAIDLVNCVKRRNSAGGTSPQAVLDELDYIETKNSGKVDDLNDERIY